jgi:hypothetical protein
MLWAFIISGMYAGLAGGFAGRDGPADQNGCTGPHRAKSSSWPSLAVSAPDYRRLQRDQVSGKHRLKINENVLHQWFGALPTRLKMA